MYDMDNAAPNGPAQMAYIESFQTATLALFQALPETVAIFSSACAIHCLSGNADFYTFMVRNPNAAMHVGGARVLPIGASRPWECRR